MPVLSEPSVCGMSSCNLMWRTLRRQPRWKWLSCLAFSAVDSPGLAGVKERGRYHCKVDLQLSKEADVPPLPDILTEASEGAASLSHPVVD